MLAWDMRLGKTAAALRAWEATKSLGALLVICPMTVCENWKREAARFCVSSPVVQILKQTKQKVDPAADIVIVNYDKFINTDLRQTLLQNANRGHWGALVLDEAHYLKTAAAERTKHIFGNSKHERHISAPLIKCAKRVWELTGTPMPNHPGELWTHCRHLYPEAIQYQGHTMEEWEFELRYCVLQQTEYGMKIVGGKNLMELKGRLEPYVSRLRERDVYPDGAPVHRRIDSWPLDMGIDHKFPDLPALVTTLHQTYGSFGAIDQFDQATIDAYLRTINAEHDQVATIRRAVGTLKAIAVTLLVREELENGGPKTVVFAHHRDAIETLQKGLQIFKPAVIHGDVTGDARQAEIDRFASDPTCQVFIGQTQASGVGIDLSAASNVVFCEAEWSPGENAQAMARVLGPNQKAPAVLIRFAYLAGSIDEAVARALARKTAMIDQVF